MMELSGSSCQRGYRGQENHSFRLQVSFHSIFLVFVGLQLLNKSVSLDFNKFIFLIGYPIWSSGDIVKFVLLSSTYQAVTAIIVGNRLIVFVVHQKVKNKNQSVAQTCKNARGLFKLFMNDKLFHILSCKNYIQYLVNFNSAMFSLKAPVHNRSHLKVRCKKSNFSLVVYTFQSVQKFLI